MQNDGLTFDLQRFSNGDGAGAGDVAAGGESDAGAAGGKGEGSDGAGKSNEGSQKGEAGKNGAAQSKEEIAAKVAEGVAAAKEKWEQEFAAKAEAKRKEEERLSKLSDDERKKAKLEAAEAELTKKAQELKIKELKLEVVEDLTKRNIPVSFLDYLVDTDSEKTLARITNFEKEYKKAIDAAVTERLKGKTPKAGDKGSSEVGVSRAKSGFLGDLKSMQARKY